MQGSLLEGLLVVLKYIYRDHEDGTNDIKNKNDALTRTAQLLRE